MDGASGEQTSRFPDRTVSTAASSAPLADLPAGGLQTVVCIKWGNQYGPEYVNRLYSMIARQARRPFRLVCLTDDASGLWSQIERHSIPAIPVPPGPERGWRKLAMFAPQMAEVLGDQALYLDLDVVLVDGIDAFFDQPGTFLIIRDWYYPLFPIGNSSVYRFRPPLSSGVYEDFCRNSQQIAKRFRNEQEYLSAFMRSSGVLQFWPRDWCCSFKRHCIPWWPLNRWRSPSVPEGSRIVVFHGYPKPPDAIVGGPARSRARAHLPAPWVADHWRA
ncbi:MAG: glycosyltransferase [Rhizomicrobium sp.]